MAKSTGMSSFESKLLEQLIPIFPNLERSIIIDSIKHPSNRSETDTEPCIQNYIDDLLELRTFTERAVVESCIPKSTNSNVVLLDNDDDDLDLLAMTKAENIGTSQEIQFAALNSEIHSDKSQSEYTKSMKDKEVLQSASLSSTVTDASSSALNFRVPSSTESSSVSDPANKPHKLYDTSWSDSESDSLDEPSDNSFSLSDSDDGLPKLSRSKYCDKSFTLCSSPKNTTNDITVQKKKFSNSSASAVKSSILSPARLFHNGGSANIKSTKSVLNPPRLILKKTMHVSSPVSDSHNMKILESSGSCILGTTDSFSKFRDGNKSPVDDDVIGGYRCSDVQYDSARAPASAASTIYRSTYLSPAKLKVRKDTVQEDKEEVDEVGMKPLEVKVKNKVMPTKTESQAIGVIQAPLHSFSGETRDEHTVHAAAIGMHSELAQEKAPHSDFHFIEKPEDTVPRDEADSSKGTGRLETEYANYLKLVHTKTENLAKANNSIKALSNHLLKKTVQLHNKQGNTEKTSPEKVVKQKELVNHGLLVNTCPASETRNLLLSKMDSKLKVPPVNLNRFHLPTASSVFDDVQVISETNTKTVKGTHSNPYLIDLKESTLTTTAGTEPSQNHQNVHKPFLKFHAVSEIKTSEIPATAAVNTLRHSEDNQVRRNIFLEPHLSVTHTQKIDRKSLMAKEITNVNPLHHVSNIVDLTQPIEAGTVNHQSVGNVTKDVHLHHNNNSRNKKNVGDANGGKALNHTAVNPTPAHLCDPPSVPAVISKEENILSTVRDMFPDVCSTYVMQLVQTYSQLMLDKDVVNNICNHLLETPAYPRAQKPATVTLVEANQTTKNEDTRDYYSEYTEMVGLQCKLQTEQMLQSCFPWISVKDIRIVMRLYRGHYAPSHQLFSKVMKQKAEESKDTKMPVYPGSRITLTVSVDGTDRSLQINFLKCRRVVRQPTYLLPELQKEVDFVERKLTEFATEEDYRIAQELNENEYEETGQLIECGCCYDEVTFDNMVQCYEGHLFCQHCLQRYAKEAVFGSGKADLLCMTDGCDASYPQTQLSRALPSNILSKYEDRVQEENINLADLPDLVRCPHCDFAALLDPRYPVFECLNTACCKKTCRHCKEDWSDHIGKTCDQVEKKDEVRLRVQFEEKMSEAKIRTCHRCKTKFTKSEGCNRMTCRCGATMCYICRKPDITYKHFCQHVRDPGKGCSSCQDCFLWSSGMEDDERAISEIKNQANKARQAQGFEDTRLIGAPDDEPVAKKARV